MDDDTIRNLDSVIAKSDPLPQTLDVFRLADSPLLHAHAARLVGCELQDLGFLDATFDARVADGYLSGGHPVVVRITAPAGTRVFPMFQTNDNDESELLFARGRRFRVLAVDLASDDTPMRMHVEMIS